MNFRNLGLAAGLCILALSASSQAEDVVSLIAQADAAYAKRDDVPEAKIAMITYDRAATAWRASPEDGRATVMGSTRAAECYWKASRSAWWLGEHAEERAERLDYFQKGMNFAQKAIALNPDSVEAHFWLGGNEGSYGDSKGVLKSLSLLKPIRHEMREVIRLNDKYLDGGAYRVLGVVDYKVPPLLGGSKTRALEELEKARAMGPQDPFTHYYLAEYYKVTGDAAKEKMELDALRTLQVVPDSLPELRMLQQRAEKL